MSAMSDYLEAALLNAVFRKVAYTSPTTVYLALYTTAASDAAGGTEVTGGAYARQAITFAAPANSADGGKFIENTADIQFPVATATWGTVTHIGLVDALTGGNLLYHGALPSSKLIENGDQFKILAGNLEISLK